MNRTETLIKKWNEALTLREEAHDKILEAQGRLHKAEQVHTLSILDEVVARKALLQYAKELKLEERDELN